jgi:hypothetical protein
VVELAVATPMDPTAATELALAAAAVAAVARLIYLNLARDLPSLLAYLIFFAGMNLVYGTLNETSSLYFWSYIVLEPLECGLSILVVRELLTVTLNDYPGIRTAGRWAMYAGVTLAVGISLVMTGYFWSGGVAGHTNSHLFYFEVSQRSVVFSLAFVIVTILLFLSKYPLNLSRNTLVSSVFFCVMFLSEACRLLIDSLTPVMHIHYVDWAENVFVAICLVGWSAMLKPEPRTVPAQIRFAPAGEEHLLQQLNSLNQLLTRAARR